MGRRGSERRQRKGTFSFLFKLEGGKEGREARLLKRWWQHGEGRALPCRLLLELPCWRGACVLLECLACNEQSPPSLHLCHAMKRGRPLREEINQRAQCKGMPRRCSGMFLPAAVIQRAAECERASKPPGHLQACPPIGGAEIQESQIGMYGRICSKLLIHATRRKGMCLMPKSPAAAAVRAACSISCLFC